MSTPKSASELTKQIEQLLTAYLADSRRAVRVAVERAFDTLPAGREHKVGAKTQKRSCQGRRSREDVVQMSVRLLELVRTRPGESMVVFAAELETSARKLERPMMLLRRDGRVRSVGQRQHTRYFPALGKAASASR